jgi:predicted MFS family arabinose efflux permease
MVNHFGASTGTASLALTVFWGMVTAGRVLFALIEKWLPETVVCRFLPLVVMAALLLTAAAPQGKPGLGLLTFGVAGLGCSALLPLAISFAQKELTTITASAAGGVVAFYQLGYGLTAFGVGPLQTWAGWSLRSIYAGTALVALATTALAWLITRKPTTPT